MPTFTSCLLPPSHVTALLPINYLSCKMFSWLFLVSTTYFASFLLPCPNFSEPCCCHPISKLPYFCFLKWYIFSVKTFDMFLFSIVNKIWIYEICILFLCRCNNTPTFVELGLYISNFRLLTVTMLQCLSSSLPHGSSATIVL